eukprot:289577-Chlamydomonas_euryale.AAC.3
MPSRTPRRLCLRCCVPMLRAAQARSCAPDAAALLADGCMAPGMARLAVKLVQAYRLRMGDLRDPARMVEFVAELLADARTLSPAVALMMSLEVRDSVFVCGVCVWGGGICVCETIKRMMDVYRTFCPFSYTAARRGHGRRFRWAEWKSLIVTAFAASSA